MSNDFYPKTGEMKTGECRSCRSEVYWIRTYNGYHPINKKALRVFFKEGGRWLMMPNVYESHFSTCPDADKWRNGEFKKKTAAPAAASAS